MLRHLSQFSKLPVAVLLIVITNLLALPTASAGDLVIVSLQNGRILTGEVDSRTDDDELWLHLTEPSIVILSSVPWTDVATARLQKRSLTATELRAAAPQLKRAIPQDTFRASRPTQSTPVAVAPRVQSLEIVPSLGNWDRGAEPDGLELRINPLTADGTSAAINGMITVRLMGRRLSSPDRLESRGSMGFYTEGASPREYAARRGNPRYQEVGRWSERLRTADATNSGYVLRLPFRNVHPEYDLELALDGQVDVHLSINGQGIHDATAPVQLRNFSPLRDELQLQRGTRFFPDEYSGR